MDWDVFLDPIVMDECDYPQGDVVHMAKVLHDAGHKIIITSVKK